MPHTHQPLQLFRQSYITPIACPKCGADAHLMRRAPHPDQKGEIRTFECMECGERTEISLAEH